MGLTMTPVRRFIDRIPAVRIVVRAVVNYVLHQSANQAGSVAFSTLLSMFPLLLFVSATAAFIGEPGTTAELAGRIMEYLPAVVAHALQPAVEEVLSQRNRALVAVGMVVTLWTASSGTLAIRTALNKAYGVERGVSFWRARIKVTLFTVVGTLCSVFVFSSVVILPYAWKLLEQATDADPNAVWLRDGVRYGLAFVVLVVLYALFYGWLPDIRQRLRTVLPGAIVGAAMWLGAAVLLSHVLRSAWKLALVYGGFAGLVATLVFLYVSAATLIFGAEINAVMLDGKQKGSAQEGADDAF
jgi:membrane protein